MTPRAVPRGLVLAFVLGAGLLVGPARATAPEIPSAEWILDQVKTLSAPEMDGRASGTPGADRAAAHLAQAFQQIGLTPGGDAGGFLRAFSVPLGIRLGPVNALGIVAPAVRVARLGTDFAPLAASSDGEAEDDVVFVGYGITAPDLGYDDYAAVDVRGKIVLAMTREPRAQDPASPFRRPEAYHYAERSHKIINARQHGARALLLVPHPGAPAERLPALRGASQPSGILAAAVTRSLAAGLLGPSGRTLAELADAIDRQLAPQSFPLTGARVRLTIGLIRDRGTAANVVGILPGTDPRLRAEAIVVGAHYDHLGRGGEGSLAPERTGVIHPGADDNASGTAVVLALARAFRAACGLPRTLVFVGFAGEELGLLGSSHYVRQPAFPLAQTVLMVNLDMVGRLRNGRVYVGGVDSAAGLRELVGRAAQGLGLTPELRGDPYAPSDHTSFYAAGRPVLFLFTGAHADYHRPGDTWDKLNPPGLVAIATFTARLVDAIGREPTAPVYARVERPSAGPRRGGGYGAFFGVVPEFGEAERPGVRVSGVRPGSPAEQAGVQAGDIIVRFGGVAVTTLEDLTFALRGKRPGDRIEAVIVRDGAERRIEATLGERR